MSEPWDVSAPVPGTIGTGRHQQHREDGMAARPAGLFDADGALLAWLKGGTLHDGTGRAVGLVSNDGSVTTRAGAFVGRISDDGRLLDPAGMLVAAGGKLPRPHGAALADARPPRSWEQAPPGPRAGRPSPAGAAPWTDSAAMRRSLGIDGAGDP